VRDKYFWKAEACDLHHDPSSGALITRLTTALKVNINIYCEQPYTTPDGKRTAIIRSQEADPRMPPFDLLVADLETLKLGLLEANCQSVFVGTVSWSGMIYYLNDRFELMRVSLDTLEKEVMLTNWTLPEDFVLQSVTADHRYLIGALTRPDFKMAIVRIDMQEKKVEIIYEHPEVLTHLQCNPVRGSDIMVQLNRGYSVNDMGERRKIEDSLGGATHFLIDINGGSERPLPVGPPYTISSSGHSAWVADTGRMAFSTHWHDMAHGGTLDERFPEGNVFTAAPGEDKPKVFHAPEHRFNHMSVSKCGRYFVSDSYWKGLPGPIAIVVGNFQTGKYRAIVEDCGASGGAAACSHPHAYFTADNRNVIYNSDQYHVPHVYAARVPDGFLASLD